MTYNVAAQSLTARVKMFLHTRRCGNCRVMFWAATAVEFSNKALIEAAKGFEERRVSRKAKIYLAIAKYATRRRLQAQRDMGQLAYEDMNPEQQAQARRVIERVQGKQEQPGQRLH